MAKSYIEFEVSKEVSDKALEAVRLARQKGSVKKGVNEVTKSVERGIASLVLIASDVEPEEVVMHLPALCKQKNVPFVYIPTKMEIGNAVGINVPCASVSIEKAAEGEHVMKDVIARLTGKAPAASKPAASQPAAGAAPQQKKKEPKKEQQPKKEQPKPAQQEAPKQ
ncbi:MAG: 50S ribosomal protein L7Ae [Candidatus Micrarchaeota archaeon]|nr:50S ribosomal protein L7Ae [Candidatus Micrarchaeota archaeon]